MRLNRQTSGGQSARWPRCASAARPLLLIMLAVFFQIRNGAYHSDFGADPDEPAHVVTSLMMRDYLATGLWRGDLPMPFAQRYYDAFPKVALGHYPPGFYLLAGLWLLPVVSKTVLMLLIAVLAAVAGIVTVHIGKHLWLEHASYAGLWFVVLPITQKQTMLMMSDLLLCTGFLLSALMFARFIDRPTARISLLFGVLAAATMLTKASGAALGLVPPLTIALTGRWNLLVNWRLWLAPIPVLLTAVPWTLLTYRITKEGMTDKTIAEYIPEAARFYLGAFVPSLGLVLVAGTLLAMSMSLFCWFARGQRLSSLSAALAGLTVSVLVLYLVSPSGLSTRYLLPLAPAAILATIWSIERIAERMGLLHARRKLVLPVLLCICIALPVLMKSGMRAKKMSGFSAAAEGLLSSDTSGRVLVSSDARGEGGLTAELALRIVNRTDSPWQVMRASKFMAESDWLGRNYQSKFADAAALATAMKNDHVNWIIHDQGIPEAYEAGHNALVKKLVDDTDAVEVVARFASERGDDVPASEILLCRLR